ncbi:family 4 glycosyl hydrolase [Arthrobacter monumenti]
MRLAILGGGGFRVPLVFRALSGGPYAGLISDVTLYDTDPVRLRAVSNVLDSMPDGGLSKPSLNVTTDLDEALTGADIVFAAIRPGSTAGRVADERVALELGLIGQETVGAGGISYALRSIPEMLRIAERLKEISPHAWLINFTNPAGMVTEALQQVLGKRVIGICDSPIGLVRRAARAVNIPATGSLSGVDYVGLNHLGWLRGLEHDGVDRLPALLADASKLSGFEEGRVFGPRLLKLLKAIPNEYLFYYYFEAEATRALTGSGQTRGEFIAAQQDELYARLAGTADTAEGPGIGGGVGGRAAAGHAGAEHGNEASANLGGMIGGAGTESTAPTAYELWDAARRSREEGYLAEARTDEEKRDESDLAGGGYEAVALAVMNAVLTDTRAHLILNVRNGSTIACLPASCVIEVPSIVDGSGAEAMPVRPLTLHQRGLMTEVKAVEESVIEAVTEGSRDAALRAFTLHPLINSANLAGRLLEGYEQAFPKLGQLWR